jgi:hypothetical protein
MNTDFRSATSASRLIPDWFDARLCNFDGERVSCHHHPTHQGRNAGVTFPYDARLVELIRLLRVRAVSIEKTGECSLSHLPELMRIFHWKKANRS